MSDHKVLLYRIECDTPLTDEEVADAVNWHLDVHPYDQDGPVPCDVSAIRFTRAVDVTPPRGIE
jgi:hypothetical protein